MTDPHGTASVREQVLAARLAAIHDRWTAKIALLEAEYQAGKLAKDLAAEQMRLATHAYDEERAEALAKAQEDSQ